ncbi:aldo/keto reductase [Streptomyces sp. NPDC098781]|uniref:aldo/keto reductase n=1 Tax=Streptomyces sp. NPDC098781 TaxID=3366097 RepID=UPI003825E66D
MWETLLGKDFRVSALGLGCSSMSHGYNPGKRDDRESAEVVRRAVDLGVTLFDTADVYGPYANEELLGRALSSCGSKAAVATKCGLVATPDGTLSRNGRPDFLRRACEGSLRRLGREAIDLYQLHRVDPAVPLEETWGALGELVTEGKVRALGISHATVDELDRVQAVFPLTAVQYELSVWSTANLDSVLAWCRDNGVGFLAFAPLGRGYLSGRVDEAGLAATDSRRRDPRFAPDAVRVNRAIVDGLRLIAERHGATPSQIAIAWVLAQGPGVVPIPGTRRLRWLEENVAATGLELTEQDLKEIAELPAAMGEMSWDRDRFPTALER